MDSISCQPLLNSEEKPGSPSPSLTDTKGSTISTSPVATPTPSRRLSYSHSSTPPASPGLKCQRTSPKSLRRFGFIESPQRIPKPESEEQLIFQLSPQRAAPVKQIPKPRPEWNNHFNSPCLEKQSKPSCNGMSPGSRTPSSNTLDKTTSTCKSIEPKNILKRKNSTSNESTGGSDNSTQVEQLRRKVSKLHDRIDLEIQKRDTISRNLMIELTSRKRFEAESRNKDQTIRELRTMLRQVSQNYENLVVTTDRCERDFNKRLKVERELRIHLESQVKQLASMLTPDVMIRMLEEQIQTMEMHEEALKPDV